MTQARSRFPTFAAYLSYSNEVALEGRYELVEGELIELPLESESNDAIANFLQFMLATLRVVPLRLIKTHTCEVQVPLLELKDPANRYPDLVVLRSEHRQLTQKRLTITREMPPPLLVAAVVSPGKTSYDRDYVRKRAQYAAIGILEYWLIDRQAQIITVLALQAEDYQEFGTFREDERIHSSLFGELSLTVEQILVAE